MNELKLTIGKKYKIFISNGFKYEVIIQSIDEDFIGVLDTTTKKVFLIGISQITTAEEVSI